MKIALIGYGKMGKTIEQIALSRGHEIVARIDVHNSDKFESEAFASADVAIEFSTPESAFDNYLKCFKADVPVVSGTTGWLMKMNEVKEICQKYGKTFFYASNFSIGVNVFFEVNKYLARLMNRLEDYKVDITEIHHIHKLDAPSGTAITIAEGITDEIDRLNGWAFADKEPAEDKIPMTSIREGEVPGTHTVRYTSAVDEIELKHEAKSREGFALGAVIAAEFTVGKKGFLNMQDLLKLNA